MPENKQRTKSCHDCGLEDLDACETKNIHRSSLEPDQLPCRACVRNPEAIGWYDFYDEQWTGMLEDGKLNPFIEDPDPQEQGLLRVFHTLVNRRVAKSEIRGVVRLGI